MFWGLRHCLPVLRRENLAVAALIGFLVVSVGVRDALGQPVPEQSREVPVNIDSGIVRNTGESPVPQPAVIWSVLIEEPEALWIRLNFATAILGEVPRTGAGSILRITSVEDGAAQVLDTVTIRQWQFASAYFNGSAVLVELIAPPNGRANRIVIDKLTAGEPPEGSMILTICGPTDDRILSDDPRAGRTAPTGCTAWMIHDAAHCFVSAGHCVAGSVQIVEFNVPLSGPNGEKRHPPPEDQYPVDPASVQGWGRGVGDDWGHFGCFPNPITGLTPYEAQGDAFVLAATPPPVQGQDIRITGYGTTSSPIPPEWYCVQKTHAGPYYSFDGTTVRYQTDTTGGNSGSPVINEDTGEAIGVHTHGGCEVGGGANHGTGSNHPGWKNAIANPKGVCAVGLKFEYPNSRPELIDPSGGTTMRVEVSGLNGGVPEPDTGKLYYDVGNGFESVPMTQVSQNVYDAEFPPAGCGLQVRYYVGAETTEGREMTDPRNAPASSYFALAAVGLDIVLDDNFERDLGWTVENIDLQDGAWERGVPAGGGARGDPPNDYDGSGQCYVTGNRPDSDVDGGPTRVTSPSIDMSAGDGFISYARWFTNDDRDDRLVVEVSDDDGQSWTLVESVGHSDSWVVSQFRLTEFVTPTDQVRIRFSASDNPNNSVTEAGLDAVKVAMPRCEPPCENIEALEVRCTARGKLKAKIFTDLPRGVHVALTNNGANPRQAVINKRGKGKAKWRKQSGQHEVCVDGCPDICESAQCP